MADDTRDADEGQDARADLDQDFEAVQCERGCQAGFKVLMGRSVIVLVCTQCHAEYEMSTSGPQDEEEGSSP